MSPLPSEKEYFKTFFLAKFFFLLLSNVLWGSKLWSIKVELNMHFIKWLLVVFFMNFKIPSKIKSRLSCWDLIDLYLIFNCTIKVWVYSCLKSLWVCLLLYSACKNWCEEQVFKPNSNPVTDICTVSMWFLLRFFFFLMLVL